MLDAERRKRLDEFNQRLVARLVALYRRKLLASFHLYLTPTARVTPPKPSERLLRVVDGLCRWYRERLEREGLSSIGKR